MSTQLKFTRLGYRPWLDGLRGVSIILVMLVHLPLIEPRLWFVPAGGKLGVDIFFALSGFLITSLLLQEIESTGRINFTRFYVRRSLRLLPALITVVLFALVVALSVGSLANLGLTRLRLLSIAFYFTNWVKAYQGPETWFLGHFWSLAIEEQFYLCWPLMLVIAKRLRMSNRHLFWAVSVLVVLSVVWKIVLFTSGAGTRRIFFGSDTRGDGILVGCALALALRGGMFQSVLNVNSARSLSMIGVLIIGVFTAVGNDQFLLVYYGGTTAVAIGSVMLIAGCWLSPESDYFKSALSNPALCWLGRRSYGLYLWHWPIYEIARLIPLRWLVAPCAVAASLVVAALAFKYIEQPFLRMKDSPSRPLEDTPSLSRAVIN